MSESVVRTAQECWDQLAGAGRLRPNDYDADLVAELRAHLSLSSTGEFRAALTGLSAQNLLEGLFASLTPLAEMMTDLLRLYETIGAARGTDPNVRFEFDFDPDAASLGFDLRTFREWEATFRRVVTKRKFWLWQQDPAWQLFYAIRHGAGQLATDQAVSPTGSRKREWPALGQPAPVSGNVDLDLRIARAWQVRENFLNDTVSRWPKRDDYRTSHDDPGGTPDEAWLLVSDFWDHSIGDELVMLARNAAIARVQRSTDVSAAETIATIIDAMDDAISQLPSFERDVHEDIRELTSLLSLPIWGKRHELYAAWIFTRIVDAIGPERLSFAVKSGRFSFDFRGAELATFDSVQGPFSVWAELRTKFDNPIGHGRTGSIQPDYRIVRAPIDDPNSSIIAVEVKQYLRSALRNPAEALADYTAGLPHADVVLAAYGPVSQRALKDVRPDALDRAYVIRHLRPGNRAPLEEFQAVVSAGVPAEASPQLVTQAIPPGQVLPREPGHDVRLELTWERMGVDLDLHAVLPGGNQTVDFGNACSDTETGSVRLEKDIRDAPGPEVLHISGEDIVKVYVHAYTPVNLGSVGAKLRLLSGPLDITLSIPFSSAHLDARWCQVLIVAPEKIQIVEEEEPPPSTP